MPMKKCSNEPVQESGQSLGKQCELGIHGFFFAFSVHCGWFRLEFVPLWRGRSGVPASGGQCHSQNSPVGAPNRRCSKPAFDGTAPIPNKDRQKRNVKPIDLWVFWNIINNNNNNKEHTRAS